MAKVCKHIANTCVSFFMHCTVLLCILFNAAQQGEISEVELLKDLLYVFQGIDGRIIRYDMPSDHYLVDSKVHHE